MAQRFPSKFINYLFGDNVVDNIFNCQKHANIVSENLLTFLYKNHSNITYVWLFLFLLLSFGQNSSVNEKDKNKIKISAVVFLCKIT